MLVDGRQAANNSGGTESGLLNVATVSSLKIFKEAGFTMHLGVLYWLAPTPLSCTNWFMRRAKVPSFTMANSNGPITPTSRPLKYGKLNDKSSVLQHSSNTSWCLISSCDGNFHITSMRQMQFKVLATYNKLIIKHIAVKIRLLSNVKITSSGIVMSRWRLLIWYERLRKCPLYPMTHALIDVCNLHLYFPWSAVKCGCNK